jgi:small conductance mechanosensitive channel
MTWMDILIRIGVFLLIILAGFVIGPIVRTLIMKMGRKATDKGVMTFLGSLANNAIKVVTIIIALSSLGVDTSVLAGTFAALGVGISLALKNNMANLAGGLQILLTKPFTVGDYVAVENYEGFCTGIEIMYTTLRTYGNQDVIVPNSTIIDNVLVNYSKEPYRRVTINVPISLDTDLSAALPAFVDVMKADSRVLADPAPTANMNAYSSDGTAIQLVLYAYCTFDNYWNVLYDLNAAIQKKRKELSVKEPFSTVNVHSQAS